ncbi:hypothetical protein Val02_91730 [Virgisporangium aliadipatigenens]|uniref:Methyltransferase domain-containing protein n=1 Tax=Virgisporangium aliadipatigenens TaxID=741659 RepID=A0A8J4DXP4_9ACTN|nr:hypothetical protein [Virgisporangium aliadipatigenens]GIJ52287.1 hypothetical protein Val02_91730 [Virgisporangium aliadipatigenens]
MTGAARAYLAWRRWNTAAGRALAAVHTGVWLGLLDRADLHAVDQHEYGRRRVYHSDAHNLRGLFDWEERVLAEYFPRGGTLLVTGAGGGREVVALSERGYRVLGFECNRELVTVGRALLDRLDRRGAALCETPRDLAPTVDGSADGVIVGWGSYMLIPDRERRVAFLRGLRDPLVPDAPLLMSFFTREPREWRARLVAAAARVTRRGRRVELGDDLAPNFVHRFTGPEIESELRDGGFRPVVYRAEGSGPYDSGFAVGLAV